jgi:hypothetical protein
MSHLYAVSQGDLTGWTHIVKVGVNPTISTGSIPETVWEGGGIYQFLTTPAQLEILSSSGLDTALGTGARSVRISGLDANWDVQVEVVTLNGTTPVTTTLTWWRINSMVIASAGITHVNQGNITLRSLAGGTTREYIAAGIGVARSLIFSVPRGHDLLLNLFAFGSIDTGKDENPVIIEARYHYHIPDTILRPVRLRVNGPQAPYHHMADPPIFIGEKVDYSWEVIAKSESPNSGVSVYISASLVDNSFHRATVDSQEHPRW